MNIGELISGKKDEGRLNIDGISIPVKSFEILLGQGYEHMRFYKESKTFSFWGKSCTACFTEEQLLERSRS